SRHPLPATRGEGPRSKTLSRWRGEGPRSKTFSPPCGGARDLDRRRCFRAVPDEVSRSKTLFPRCAGRGISIETFSPRCGGATDLLPAEKSPPRATASAAERVEGWL